MSVVLVKFKRFWCGKRLSACATRQHLIIILAVLGLVMTQLAGEREATLADVTNVRLFIHVLSAMSLQVTSLREVKSCVKRSKNIFSDTCTLR